MRGGVVFYRGTGAAARAYVESDHSHADEYYLENGDAIAQLTVRDSSGEVRIASDLDGEQYQAWVDWRDPVTGESRGVPRDETRITKEGEITTRPSSPRFAEMTVNCDKSLSVAAALFPEVSAALDDAQAQAADAMGSYLARNSVTRVGSRGEQEFVPVERFEQVAVVHRTSRAGDPHRHIHVQWNLRVFAADRWRGLHTAATIKQQGALRGVAEAVISAHPGLRAALRSAGLTYDATTGKVVELAAHAELMSKRAMQVQQNLAMIEAEWRAANPGREPLHAQRREWDQQAWALGRPQKVHDTGRAEDRWTGELYAAGLRVGDFRGRDNVTPPIELHQVDRAAVTHAAIGALEQSRSAWSLADLQGQIGTTLAQQGVIGSRREIEDWVMSTAAAAADTLLRIDIDYAGEVPDWVRWVTSERVVAVEEDLRAWFAERGLQSVLVTGGATIDGLTSAQSDAARALGGTAPLVVVEGAAGAGKTTMLAAAAGVAAADGRRIVVVAPTLVAAEEAGAALGTSASSAHKLAHEYGFRQDDDGRWSRLAIGDVDMFTGAVYEGPAAEYRVDERTRIIVDEAGMIDQDVAHALFQIADQERASVAFVGDRAQLAAVGRGGVLDMAVAAHPTPLDLTDVHRFRDAQDRPDHEYAALTLQMRDRDRPGELFDRLYDRGHIAVHATIEDVRSAVTDDAITRARAGGTVAIAAATNEEASAINAVVQKAHADAGHTRAARVEVTGSDLLTLRLGDRIMTRENNRELGVANRRVWDVQRVHRDGAITVTDGARVTKLPNSYVRQHTHLAYASTEYGVQGSTVQAGHGIITDASTASAVYVAATRGRQSNTLHVVAETREQARSMFIDAMRRDNGDRGIETAREAARRDLDGIVGTRRPNEAHREQARWWGVDVDRAAADTARTKPTRRQARDSEATRIVRDTEAKRNRTRRRDRGLDL